MSSTTKLKRANKAFRQTLPEGVHIRVTRTIDVNNSAYDKDKSHTQSSCSSVGFRRK